MDIIITIIPERAKTHSLQKREALSNACDPIIVRDSKGDAIATTYFYVCDFDDKYVYMERYAWNSGGDNESPYGEIFND